MRGSDLRSPRGSLPAGITLVDPVVSNTNPSLATTDTFPDGEPSIGVDPTNPSHVTIEAFSSCWLAVCDANANAALWTSTNGGSTWTKSYSVPPPPNGVGAASYCPCDQTPDYGRNGTMFSTFLAESTSGHVYSGSTIDPTTATAWSWHVTGATADQTNLSTADPDQPWLLVNRDPITAAQDDAYVAYDDFATLAPTPRVAAAPGSAPPGFTIDQAVGTGPSCCVNPGLRLAVDHASGTVYSLWQQATYNGSASPPITVQYMLNRSTDGGQTWSLNGNPGGIQVDGGPSDQIYDSYTVAPYKFGTVNALLGGIDSAAVDPTSGDVYYAYGLRDTTSTSNRLMISRLTSNGTGGLAVGTPTAITGQGQAALPSVAVAADGTVGVLYDTYDGMDSGGYPTFTAHLAQSSDHGASFTDTALFQFSSPEQDNANARQRVLGDYQQLKADGLNFDGTFTANGVGFGRSTANTDPIFFSVDRTPPNTTITSGPASGSTTRDATPTFAFASAAGATFACKVDGGSYAACTSPKTTALLRDGSHTFAVRATDQAANTDPSPASRTFRVDTTPPKTTITSGPRQTTTKTTATFKFKSSESQSSFKCKLDRQNYKPCHSPHTYRHLKPGSHKFSARATDAAGNVGKPATKSWKIKK